MGIHALQTAFGWPLTSLGLLNPEVPGGIPQADLRRLAESFFATPKGGSDPLEGVLPSQPLVGSILFHPEPRLGEDSTCLLGTLNGIAPTRCRRPAPLVLPWLTKTCGPGWPGSSPNCPRYKDLRSTNLPPAPILFLWSLRTFCPPPDLVAHRRPRLPGPSARLSGSQFWSFGLTNSSGRSFGLSPSSARPSGSFGPLFCATPKGSFGLAPYRCQPDSSLGLLASRGGTPGAWAPVRVLPFCTAGEPCVPKLIQPPPAALGGLGKVLRPFPLRP